MNLLTQLQKDHQELYPCLEALLLDLTKVKNERDDEFLIAKINQLLVYIEELLAGHFQIEEKEFFPELLHNDPSRKELINRLLKDHQEIEAKFSDLKTRLAEFQQSLLIRDLDYQKMLLYPAYNLIATINHHALREDREILDI